MHPQITERRRKRCGDLIEALEKCHANGFVTKAFGSCNEVNEAVNACLHQERLERQEAHLKQTREKRKALEKKWKQLEEEEFGPGGYLKEVLKKTSS